MLGSVITVADRFLDMSLSKSQAKASAEKLFNRRLDLLGGG